MKQQDPRNCEAWWQVLGQPPRLRRRAQRQTTTEMNLSPSRGPTLAIETRLAESHKGMQGYTDASPPSVPAPPLCGNSISLTGVQKPTRAGSTYHIACGFLVRDGESYLQRNLCRISFLAQQTGDYRIMYYENHSTDSFEVPPPQKWFFRGQKMKIPH